MDTQSINTELYRRTGRKVDVDDPAFMLVVLNQILLEQQAGEISERVAVVADGFERQTRRSADELIETVNKVSSVIQGQVTLLEATALKVSVPELIQQKYPNEGRQEVSTAHGADSVAGSWVWVGFYAAGVITGLCVAGLAWVFFK